MEQYVCEIETSYKRLPGFRTKKLDDTGKVLRLIRKIIPKEQVSNCEWFGAIYLDNALNIKGYKIVSKGGLTGTICDIRVLFQAALLCNATRLITFHNHPTGNLTASKRDIKIHNQIKKAGEIMDIELIDNLIISNKGFSTI